METKVCSGTHGCGRELPFEMFGTYKKKGRTYFRTNCRSCEAVKVKQWRHNNKEKWKANWDQWSERTKSHRKKYIKEYVRDPEVMIHKSIKQKSERDNLSDTYVKKTLAVTGIYDPSPKIIQAKRLQLMLYRETKKIKNGY